MKAAAEKQRAAVAAQKEAVKRQAQFVGLSLEPWGSAPIPPVLDCDPIADSIIVPIIESAAKARDLKPALVRAVMEQESAMRPCAESVKGAQGLMQLMPETCSQLGVKDPFDVKENVEAGAKYLRSLLDLFKGDLRQALGAYNAGPAAATQAGGVPDIPETRNYVDAIMNKLGNKP
jgi:soluble lytic murein transglycosylase-like protein